MLAFVITATFFPMSSWAADVVASGNCGAKDNPGGAASVTWTLDSNGVLTISGSGEMRDYSYTQAPWWYSYSDEIVSLEIKPGVTGIGSCAFSSCENLASVTFSDSVNRIGSSAFEACSKLDHIIIPNMVSEISVWAFGDCSNLTDVTLSESITKIDEYAFKGCGLKQIHIPSSTTTIEAMAFAFCDDLTQITVDANNTAFKSVDGVLFSKDMTALFQYPDGKTANYYATPDNVLYIKSGAFTGAKHLQAVSIPHGIQSIEDIAFQRCTKLQNVYYYGTDEEWSAVSIGSYNDSLANATVYTAIASGYCGDNLTWVLDSDGILTISGTGDMSDYGSYGPWFRNIINIKNVIIKDGVTSIGNCAFCQCRNLINISIPSSVSKIGKYAFFNSPTSISVDTGNPYYSSINGSLYNKNQTILLWGKSTERELFIPASVQEISEEMFRFKGETIYTVSSESNSFSSNDGVLYDKDKTILLRYSTGKIDPVFSVPEGVTQIGKYAFSDCKNLKSVELPDGVVAICDSAFYSCGLNDVSIPSSITSIGGSFWGESAFDNCAGLERVIYGGTRSQWEDLELSRFFDQYGIADTGYSVYYLGDGDQVPDDKKWSEIWIVNASLLIKKGSYAEISMELNMEPKAGNDAVLKFYYTTKELEHTPLITLSLSGTDRLQTVELPENVVSVIENYGLQNYLNNNQDWNVYVSVADHGGTARDSRLINLTSLFSPRNTIPSSAKLDAYGRALTVEIDGDVDVGDVFRVYEGENKSAAFENTTTKRTLTVISSSQIDNTTIPGHATVSFTFTKSNELYPSNSNKLFVTFTDKENARRESELQEIDCAEVPTFWVTFEGNGGDVSIAGKTVRYRDSYGDLPTPTRKDYRFDGWFTAANGGNQITSNTTVDLSANQTLYAHWTYAPASYTVTFNANGGTVSPTSKTVTNGEKYGDLPTPTRKDYRFEGWFTAANGGNQITSNTTVDLSANQTLYAHWTYAPASYTVTFDPNGGSVTPSTLTVEAGKAVGTLPTPTRSGYTFNGWFTERDGGTPVNENTPVNANVTYYAHWTQLKTYTVSYNANGGTGTPSPQTKVEDVPLTLSETTPTKTYVLQYNANGGSVTPASKTVSCTFTSWNTYQNGGGNTYLPGGSYTKNEAVTLYAQFTNPAAGTLATPTRSGYSFLGWFSSATGGMRITEGSIVTGNMTLYAHWYDPYNLGDETYSFSNYGDSDSPGGHCFGMSITSAGYHNDLLNISSIGGSASTSLYSFSLTPTVKSPICYYQGIQGSYSNMAIVAGGSRYLTGTDNIASDWQQVVNYVRDHSYDNTGLLQIGFRKSVEGGHAINFLRYESVNGQDRLYAYDNNFPTQETYFYRDSSGKVFQAPVQTFSGSIDCIALRDVRIYFENVDDFDATHVLYMAKDAATVVGYTGSYLEGVFPDTEYVMY